MNRVVVVLLGMILIFTGCNSDQHKPETVPEQIPKVMPNEMPEDIALSDRYATSKRTLPSEQEKLSVLVRSVDEEINEIEPSNNEYNFDSEIEEDLLKKKMEQIKPIQGLFETTIETVRADDKISINFALKNISGKDMQISYGSGQQYDIKIYNEHNEEVYTWSNNRAFTMALIVTGFSKSGQLTFNEDWNLEDNKGNLVPTGKYTIEVRVMIGSELGNISQDELIAENIVEI